jgi:hypothetical protein
MFFFYQIGILYSTFVPDCIGIFDILYIYIVTQTHPLTCAFYCIQLVLIHSCQMGLVKKFEANKHHQKDCLTTCDSNKISTISVNIHTVPQKSTKIPKVKTNCGDSRMFSYLQSTFL